ncbi:MAG: ribonuclease P protein component [Sandaracinaceae bacterium]|nr:ribonuclease P protein component [Sandaracinaceae bacterium]
MTEAYPPSARVRRRADYRRIQSGRSRVHTRHFLIVLAAAPVGTQRLGVTVTKKVGNAVVRNRIKRVVREVFRRNRELFPDATDVVFIAKQGAGAVRYAELLADVASARDALAKQRARLAPPPATEGARNGASS